MSLKEKASTFAALHRKGDPVILYNIWDAGSAAAVARAGAKALATGSWPLAGAQGYGDGQQIPLEKVIETARTIIVASDLPVSVDFEGTYSDDPREGAENTARLIDIGAVGINIEDQVVGASGLHSTEQQAVRIHAIRDMADARDIPFFINARTDLFIKESDQAKHSGLIDEAIARGLAYAAAGASGFFVPGLSDLALIGKICDAVDLPVNILKKPGMASVAEIAAAGAGRISYGPFPYRAMIEWLEGQAAAVYAPA